MSDLRHPFSGKVVVIGPRRCSNGANLVQTAPLPCRRDSARGLVVLPLNAQPARRRRGNGASRCRCELRDSPRMDGKVRTEDRCESPAA